jgi:hypothetical protein
MCGNRCPVSPSVWVPSLLTAGQRAAGSRRLTGVDDMDFPVGGLTHGEIASHLAEVYGADSPA